jgi:hypothetical protein
MADPSAVSRLSLWLRVTGVVFLAFFGAAFVLTVMGESGHLGMLTTLTVWGMGGEAYVLMIATVYVVWAVFILRAPGDLAGNRALIDFTITGNLAHFTLMLVMSFVIPGEHLHAVGDVLGGYVLIVPLTLLWLPVRRGLTPT